MVWLVWGWFGLNCHILGWFGLFWVGLGRFGLFQGRTAPSPQNRAPPNRPAPRHPGEPGAHWPASPSAQAFSTSDWAGFQSIFHLPTFRLAALERRGAPVPLGGRRGAGPGARCVIRGGIPRNFPDGIPCRHGALLPGTEIHPPGEGGGENRRGGSPRVAVACRDCASWLPYQRGGGALCACAGIVLSWRRGWGWA